MPSLSIIIPTLNEAAYLKQTLECLQLLEPLPSEIIVVDGGSVDDTVTIAKNYGTITIVSPLARRAIQMNQGARTANGELLCFLHADTLVPQDLVTLIEKALDNTQIACGGFISLMMGERKRWVTSFHNYLKTYYAPLLFRPHLFVLRGLRLLFGDQVMFCRRSDFWQCGGFDPNLPIMEDADLCLKLIEKGRIYLLHRLVRSSDRRVVKLGAIKANLIYFWVGFLWGLGVKAPYLKKFYPNIR
ncbi:MAG: TIGR04283 family arsenosugar biosynthesis glycosyltransferase [Cyanobacteria bacterium P01_G01_bin.49]